MGFPVTIVGQKEWWTTQCNREVERRSTLSELSKKYETHVADNPFPIVLHHVVRPKWARKEMDERVYQTALTYKNKEDWNNCCKAEENLQSHKRYTSTLRESLMVTAHCLQDHDVTPKEFEEREEYWATRQSDWD